MEEDNKLVYYPPPKSLHIGPDKVLSGPPARREILSDPNMTITVSFSEISEGSSDPERSRRGAGENVSKPARRACSFLAEQVARLKGLRMSAVKFKRVGSWNMSWGKVTINYK